MKQPIIGGILGLFLLGPAAASAAQAYPAKPITLIAPFAPGASADGVARILARRLSEELGKPVVVENRAGAGGTTGLIALGHAAPDGYTLGIGATGAIAVNRHLPDAAPFDPDKQLAPVAKVADIPLVFVASEKSGLKSLADVMRESGKPGGISYGTSGQFTSQHLAGALFGTTTKSNLVAVPYRGSAPALSDVMANQVPLAVVDLTSAIGAIKGGKVSPLAVTGPRRAVGAPSVPTVAEEGHPGYSASGWLGMFAPAGTPPEIVAGLSGHLEKILKDQKVNAEFAALAVEPSFQDSAEFSRYIADESSKWGAVVEQLGAFKP